MGRVSNMAPFLNKKLSRFYKASYNQKRRNHNMKIKTKNSDYKSVMAMAREERKKP